jgi:hypothetical protein
MWTEGASGDSSPSQIISAEDVLLKAKKSKTHVKLHVERRYV